MSSSAVPVERLHCTKKRCAKGTRERRASKRLGPGHSLVYVLKSRAQMTPPSRHARLTIDATASRRSAFWVVIISNPIVAAVAFVRGTQGGGHSEPAQVVRH